MFGDALDAIGLTRLRAELGYQTPTGDGISVAQVEAANQFGTYFIDVDDPNFEGKEFTDRTGINPSPYGHSRQVGLALYGNDTGVAPDINRVDLYSAVDWYDRVIRRADTAYLGPPLLEQALVQNHSWVAYRDPDTSLDESIDILRRLDHQVQRDGTVVVVSLQNGADAGLPDLLAHAYNVISVGKSDGQHSAGISLFDEPGRFKPDLVAPRDFTSFATPLVSGAAALLLEHAGTREELAAATRPDVVKAIMLAGATKAEFPAWSRTWRQPLDPVYGAGELNVRHNHHILDAGPPGPSNQVGWTGWDAGRLDGDLPVRRYRFHVPESMMLRDFSAALTWLRRIEDGPEPGFDAQPVMADLDLRLYRVGEEDAVDESLSAIDNVEHLHQAVLGSGIYELEVRGDRAWEFGLAWRADVEARPEIVSIFRHASGQFYARARVAPGHKYSVEATGDFEGWRRVASTSATSGEIVFPLASDAAEVHSCRVVVTP